MELTGNENTNLERPLAQSDRPFTRKLAKLAMLFRHGPNGAHFQDCWPGLELRRADVPGPGQVRYKGREIVPLTHWSVLQDGRFGEVTIIGSGPSVSGQDVSQLGREAVVLLNGALHLRAEVSGPVLVAVEDERFVWRHFALMRQKVRGNDLCLFSPAVLRAICENDADWLAGRTIILAENILRPFDALRRRVTDVALRGQVLAGPGTALSLNPDLGFIGAGTVAFTALQAMMAAGSRSIGLAGVDLSNAGQPRFYETVNTAARSGIAGAAGPILQHFALALAECGRRGVGLVSYSPHSALALIGMPVSARLEAVERR